MNDKSLRVGFIGAGRAANTLALGLHQSGYRVTSVASRTLASAQALAVYINGCIPSKTPQEVADDCDLVFITTPDDTIESIVKSVSWNTTTGVAHCSGAEPSLILEAARLQGAHIGSFHPMQTFPTISHETARLSGIAFAVEGAPPMLDTLIKMANALGGFPVEISPEHRAIYHLTGFLACGAVITIMSQAAELWNTIGYTKDKGLEVLIPILKSTVESLEARGIPEALTGPISRGDLGTVQKHLGALEDQAISMISIYCEIALRAVALSRAKGGIDDSRAQEIATLLQNQLARAKTLPVV